MRLRFRFVVLLATLFLVPLMMAPAGLRAGLVSDAAAQKLEVGVVGGYRMGGSFRFDRVGPLGQISSTHFETEDGADLSFQISAPVQPYAAAEIIFDFQNTSMSAKETNSDLQSVDVKIYTVHIGGMYTTSQDKIQPMLGGSVGISIFSPDDRSNTTRFSMGFTGGVKAYLSDSFGLRAQTRLVMALVQSANFFCGPGAGACYTAGGSIFTQINFGLGAFIRI
jgi:hypothetical protein